MTAAALAHVNRLPVLLLPGDIFVSRAPDPVLQQVEDFNDGGVSANDAFKPVSRYFDRIVHPAQLLSALPRAMRVLTDAAMCGPVTLALPQDVQAQAWDFPADFFEPRVVRFHAPPPRLDEIDAAVARLRRAKRPLIVAGGGVLYGRATDALHALRQRARHSGCGNAGRQGLARVERSAERGRIGRDRFASGQRARARRRLRARDRHAPAGLHDRLEYAVHAGAT